jgi:prepilin-type N-terminal cleavage/methylation domain-containing protein
MKKNGQSGVSLVELLIVIAIIGILAMILGVNFLRSRDSQNVRAAALEVEGDITEARTMALSRNRLHRITFDVGAPTYRIEECQVIATTNCPGGNWTLVGAKDISSGRDGVSFLAANNGGFIVFQMRGTADNVTVVIQSSRVPTQATLTTNFRARTYVTYSN